MYRYSHISFAILKASAVQINIESNSDLPQCTWDDTARWLPKYSISVSPEVERECHSADAENNFEDCDCIPSRLINWDTDANMMTDLSLLDTDELANRDL